jgi:hypothetical protein
MTRNNEELVLELQHGDNIMASRYLKSEDNNLDSRLNNEYPILAPTAKIILYNSEVFLQTGSKNLASLLKCETKIISSSFKLLLGTTTSKEEACDSVSSSLLISKLLKSTVIDGNLNSATACSQASGWNKEDSAALASFEVFKTIVDGSSINVVTAADTFSAEVVKHDSHMMREKHSETDKKLDPKIRQSVNNVLNELDVKDCTKVERYLRDLSLTEKHIESILIADRDVVATRKELTSFIEMNSETHQHLAFLQAASPVV